MQRAMKPSCPQPTAAAAIASIRQATLLAHALVLLAVAGPAVSARAAAPAAASGTFVSHTYAFTFRAPAGATYCRLADDWTGSDHGTILFLTPPSACDGAGFPSMSRGFVPGTTPRLEVYYDHWDAEIDRPSSCRRIGRVRFLGRLRPLCRSVSDGLTEISVTGYYTADSTATATVTLVTPAARLQHDLAALRALIGTARTCSAPWRDAQGARRVTGSGPPCPDDGDFY